MASNFRQLGFPGGTWGSFKGNYKDPCEGEPRQQKFLGKLGNAGVACDLVHYNYNMLVKYGIFNWCHLKYQL